MADNNTKTAIAGAFLDLSKRKSIDKISVKDLVETCGISRQTFYYHFQDILEVIEWLAQRFFQLALERGLAAAEPEEALEVFIEYSAEAEGLLRKLLSSRRRQQIERILVDTVRAYLEGLIKGKGAAAPLPYADMEAALDFCTYGVVGMLLRNCGRKELDKKQQARQMCLLFSRLLVEPTDRDRQGAKARP